MFDITTFTTHHGHVGDWVLLCNRERKKERIMPCPSPEARMKSLRIMYVQFNVSKVLINNLVRNSEASFFESSCSWFLHALENDAHGSFML